jgi:hypothetical protein
VDGSGDLARGHIQRGEQRGDAVAHVAVLRRSGMPDIIGSTGADRSKAWIWLCSSTQHDRVFRRVDRQPDDTHELCR